MYNKKIAYDDFDGNHRVEEFMFNITEAELTMWQLSVDGGMQEKLRKIVEKKDAPAVMNNLREIILKAYGEKSPDGRRFMKSKEISENFEATNAFSKLFMELCTDSDAAAEFVNRIMPPELAEAAKSEVDKVSKNPEEYLASLE